MKRQHALSHAPSLLPRAIIPSSLTWYETNPDFTCIPVAKYQLRMLQPESRLKSLSLNLNTEAKSGSAGSDVVVSEAVGVRVGVASCCRGLKKRGSGGIVVVKLDVISGIAVAC
ncbi:hypothetical protein Tco_0517386 [Tanacetum coccineum]